jgi:hypothetical protein
LIPFKDVLSPHLVCRKYLLYSLNSNPGRTNLGAVSLNFNSQAYKETLTEKDLYFKKRFLVNESWVEKDVNFERDIPRTGFLIIAVNKVARFEQMLQLLANIKQDLRLDMKKTEHRLRLELRVNEADEDVSKVVFRKREPSIIKEEREDSQDSERDNQGKVEELEEPFKFQEMVIPIRSKTINSLEDAFEFLDTLGREGVSLYHLSKSDVRLTDQALDYLQSRELEFSLVLYLESDLHSANYVCGKAIEPFSTFLTTQNNAGHQKSLALVNGSGGQICELDTLLNYTKVFHDDLFIDTMNKYNEYREAFDQVRQRTLVINLVNIVYQSRQPKQRARNKLFFLKARVGALVEVTYLIDSTENETITESYLNLENNKNVIVLRLVDLYLEDDIHSLYQDFVKKEGRVAVQQHVAESVPSLDLTLIEKSLQGTEEQIGYLSIDLRHMLLSSLGGPGERTDWYKGLLPFEASPATKCFQPLREPSISEGTFTTEERSKSVPMDLLGLFSQSPEAASVVLVNARVGLKMLVINERSAGLFRAEDYECLRRLLNIDWCQDVERFATRVGLYGTGIEGDELDMGAHGFIAKQAVLTKMLREHLKVPLNHLESLVGIIGSDEQKVEMLNLQHLLRNPISSALTLDARNIERKFVEELLVVKIYNY